MLPHHWIPLDNSLHGLFTLKILQKRSVQFESVKEKLTLEAGYERHRSSFRSQAWTAPTSLPLLHIFECSKISKFIGFNLKNV